MLNQHRKRPGFGREFLRRHMSRPNQNLAATDAILTVKSWRSSFVQSPFPLNILPLHKDAPQDFEILEKSRDNAMDKPWEKHNQNTGKFSPKPDRY